MSEGKRKWPNFWFIGAVVVVLGISALNISVGEFPWILVVSALPFILYLIWRIFPSITSAGRSQEELDPASTATSGPPMSTDQAAAPTVAVQSPSPEVLARVSELKNAGQTVEAIEVLRKETGMELYEASNYVRGL